MNEERAKGNHVLWQPVAAFACFLGSLLSLLMGCVLTTGWLVNGQRHPVLHGVGLALLIVGFPLLILGGYYLDLMEERGRGGRWGGKQKGSRQRQKSRGQTMEEKSWRQNSNV